MAESTEALLGFTLWVTPRPGLTDAEQSEYQRRLEDYIDGCVFQPIVDGISG